MITTSRKPYAAAIFFINIALEITVVTGFVAGPTFQRVFDLSKTELGIALGATDIGMLVVAPLAGQITYRRGSFFTLVLGLLVNLAGIALIGEAGGFAVLVVGLACVGASVGLIANANATFLADLFPGGLLRIMSLASSGSLMPPTASTGTLPTACLTLAARGSSALRWS